MKLRHSAFGYVLAAVCVFGVASCSSSPKPAPQEKVEVMPTEYPKTAIQTLNALQPNIPEKTDAVMVVSYGSLADVIIQMKNWNLVDNSQIDSALKDLEMHYLLNPTKLADYYKAGMNTASGLAVGFAHNNVYILFDVYNTKKFKSWLDNFMNEEFGRPRYQEETIGSKTVTEIRILDRDFATLLSEENRSAILVLGEGLIKDSPASLECAKQLAEEQSIPKSKADEIAKMLSNAPIAVWTHGPEQLLDRIPEKYAQYAHIFSNVVCDMNFSEQGPKLHLQGHWNTGEQIVGLKLDSLKDLGKGSNGGWGDIIMSTGPSTATRLLFDAQKLEEIILPSLSDKTKNTYQDIKKQLTQKLFKIDVADQIIYNIGGVWVALYDTQVPNLQEPSLKDILFAQKGVVYLPFKEAGKSDAFFAKLNILKGFIPSDKAQIEMEDGILHAVVNLGANQKLHAGYYKGIIALSTSNGWAMAVKTLKTSDSPNSPSLLASDNHFFASHIAVEDIVKILGMRYGIVKEQLSNFLAPVNSIEIQSSMNDTSFDITLNGILNKN